MDGALGFFFLGHEVIERRAIAVAERFTAIAITKDLNRLPVLEGIPAVIS